MQLSHVLIGTGAGLFRSSGTGLVEGVLAPSELDIDFSGFATDSRQVAPGDLFFALPGERVDGHAYIGEALRAGARGVVVNKRFAPPDLHPDRYLLHVESPQKSLESLGAYWRSLHSVDIVGVTGSLGKTSVKEFTAFVLESNFPGQVLKSEGNLNSEVGLPLQLLKLTPRHRLAVLEMGMYQPGDIALLAGIAKPTVGIVTNVYANHLARTGSIERTARGKAELVHALPPSGLAILNGADKYARGMAASTSARTVFYGQSPSHYDFVVSSINGLGHRGFQAVVRHGRRMEQVTCASPGAHNAANILPALAAGHHFGLSLEDMTHSLSAFCLPGRSNFLPGPSGSLILDDRYNASAESMIAALRLVQEEPGTRHLAILGEMFELGALEEAEHRRVGRAASSLDALILVGERTRWIQEEAERSGMPSGRVTWVEDNQGAAEAAIEILRRGDVMLVKGSRGLHLETVVEALTSTGGSRP